MKLTRISLLLLLIPALAHAKDWDPRLGQALQQAYAGTPEAGLPIMQSYRQDQPDDPNGYFVESMVLEWKTGLEAGDHRKAYPGLLQKYKKANDLAYILWEKDPENVDRLIDLGNSYFLLARMHGNMGSGLKAGMVGRKCQKYMEEAMQKDPSRVDALLPLGAFHYFAGNTPKSMESLKKLFGIKGDKTLGLAELNKAASGSHPYVLNARYALLEIMSGPEKKYAEAQAMVTQFSNEFPKNPIGPLKIAQLEGRQDKAKGAQSLVDFTATCPQKFPPCHPKFLLYAYSEAGRLFKGAGQMAEAKKYLAEAEGVDQKNYPEKTAQIFLWSGQVAQAQGDQAAAENYFKKAEKTSGIPKRLKKEIEANLEKLKGKGDPAPAATDNVSAAPSGLDND